MGPLGWIPPHERSVELQRMHEDIMNAAPKMALARPTVPKGTKIILNDYFAKPEVIADIGEVFTGFHQLTGSCVGVSEGDAIAVLSAVQRCIADEPTQAMIPWWGFPYGRSRFKAGMRTKGEGSVDSIMGDIIREEGCFAINDPNFKTHIEFKKDDGWYVPANVELDWSDGDETLVTQYLELAKHYPVGSVTPVEDIDGVCAGIINGAPCLNGCNYFIGHGRIKSSPGGDYVVGEYDGRGGHSTCYSAYWEHPNDGPLLGYWNQWPTSTYPKDPARLARCMVWTPEAKAAQLFRLGGDGGETMLLSRFKYLPAQPKVLDWALI
jgi:hypothetical protein